MAIVLLPGLNPLHLWFVCRYVPAQKVFATCVGPKVVLAYVPKVCILEEETQQVG
jgi:hypothetical protein